MWETIKNDPLLKTIAIFILGVLAFGLAFNIMFGPYSGGSEHGGSGGYNLDVTLSYVLGMVSKLVLIGLFVVLLIVLGKTAKKISAEENWSIGQDFRLTDPLMKVGVGLIGGILVISLLLSLFRGSGPVGLAHPADFQMMANVQYMPYGNNSGTSDILGILAKTLLIVSVLGLLISLFLYLTRGLDGNPLIKLTKGLGITNQAVKCPVCGSDVGDKFSFCPGCGSRLIDTCDCGTQLKTNWVCCPTCGREKQANLNESTETAEG